VSLRLAYLVVPEDLLELVANIRTQMDGFTPVLTQKTMSLFMSEGHFSSHLRRMRTLYGSKRNRLIEALAPMADLGWRWSSNPAGMHLLVRHRNSEYVRLVTQASKLDLALLSRYRISRGQDDGLFLRFGALDFPTLQTAAQHLVTVAKKLANRNLR
jgi:GntR family transcriptional regulator / MocR family aminotransferase